MTPIRILLSRLFGLFRRSSSEKELDEELQFHFQQEIDHHISRGMSPEEARRAARARSAVSTKLRNCIARRAASPGSKLSSVTFFMVCACFARTRASLR